VTMVVSETGRLRKISEEALFQTIKEVPIFSELTEKEYRKIARIAHIRYFRSNEVIFREGQPGAGMYIIHNGEVEIIKYLPSGENHVLAVLKNGDFFGELALLDEEPRSATAVTATRSEIIGFFRPDFLDFLHRHPRIGVKILININRFVSDRLNNTSQILLEQGKSLPV